MNSPYESGESINQPLPPEHEAQDDCSNPSDADDCSEYTDARAE